MLMINNLVGFGAFVGGFGPATSAFSCTLDTDNAGTANVSYRTIYPLSAAGSQIRVKFRGNTGGTLNVDNAAIGIQNSVVATVATPVELLFGGVSGFSSVNSAEVWSDWLEFVQSGVNVVIIQDIAAVGFAIRFLGAAGTGGWYQRTSYNSYNEAAPASFTLAGGVSSVNIDAIEVRTAL